MEIKYIKTSPTENMTILVESPVPVAAQLALAEKLMAYHSVHGEQVGFLHEATVPGAAKGLRMMAGEFCGNASMSLAAWLMEQKNLPVGASQTVLLEVSGVSVPVACTMTREKKGYSGSVQMPLPLAITTQTFMLDQQHYTLPVVRFEGITHVIVAKSLWGENARMQAEKAAVAWAADLPQVFGILLWEEASGELEPLVCVQGSSLIWERGCGSGTSAIGAYIAQTTAATADIACRQPGGVMQVRAEIHAGVLHALEIMGHVDIVCVGTAFIE